MNMVKWHMDYTQERFALNRLAQFRSREVESEFIEQDRTTYLTATQVTLLVIGAIFFLFVFTDYHFYGERDTFSAVILIRIIGLPISITAFFAVKKFERYENALVFVTVIQVFLFALYLLIVFILPGNQADMQYMTTILFLLAVFLIPNVWKNSFAAACLILTGFIIIRVHIVNPAGIEEVLPIIMRGLYLCVCLAGCAIFIYGREKSRRKQFAAERLLEFISITDVLTGINNRRHFEAVSSTWVKGGRRFPLSLLLFDIDNFKRVNDNFGHPTGDQVLMGVSQVVSAHIRDEDIFARWGGEEFVILLSGTTLEKAVERAECLRRVVEVTPFDKVGKVTISIGLAEYIHGETIADFVNRADKKMYEAKQAGRNQVMA